MSLPGVLAVRATHDHAQGQAGVELDRLRVLGCGRARQARLQRRHNLTQSVLPPGRQTGDQEGQGEAGAGASDDAGGVLTGVGALRRRAERPSEAKNKGAHTAVYFYLCEDFQQHNVFRNPLPQRWAS